ncbi:hypothetical protein [Streptomyces sp. FIT100]|uniref:hypothetical protein n=1 Tax=Streptomyces sp. FIT100 TaxID=2837956 RepID=UPI0021C92D81|nr:hypothetical protein [Streptomyces sp. FIT100]UUN28521.1 hypothetical protein KK483_20675 [Streptomyces sp. FIT100]
MIRPVPGRRVRALPAAVCGVVLAAVVTAGWYATRPVAPACTFAVSKLADANGDPLPDGDGVVRSDQELARRAYQEAIAAGRCEAPQPRWRRWLG